MKIKEMIEYLEEVMVWCDRVYDNKGGKEKFVAIIKSLQHYDILMKDYKESTRDPIDE